MTAKSANIRVGSVTTLGLDAQNQTPSFYEFAIWSGRVLSATDVAALYDIKNGLNFGYPSQEQYKISGFTSVLPRRLLSERDSATGSYPTVVRTGDSRSGKYGVSFDDTKTLVFQQYSGSNSVNFGTMALSGAYYQNDLVAKPSSAPTLTGSGSIVIGVSDANIKFTKGQDLQPFKEQDLYAISSASLNDPFYKTGSAPADVGLGLSDPVWSKAKISLPVNPIQSDAFRTKRGGASTAADGGVNFPMQYFNFAEQKWEGVGTGYQPGNRATGIGGVSINTRGNTSTLAYTPIGFSPGSFRNNADIGVNEQNVAMLSQAAVQISNFGFPFSPLYEATGSQLFSLSGERS